MRKVSTEKRKKMRILTVITSIIILMLCFVVFNQDRIEYKAKENKLYNVAKDADYGVKIDKKANWTSYGGSYTDAYGNPYVKYDITIDATEASVQLNKKTRSTDVILLIDTSSSMAGTKLARAKASAIELIRTCMSKGNNIKFAVRTYDLTERQVCPLTSDQTTLVNAINSITVSASNASDIQGAIIGAQNDILYDSYADKTAILLLADGYPTVTHNTGDEYVVRNETPKTATELQAQFAKDTFENLSIYTVGYGADVATNILLASMASFNKEDKLLNYVASDETSIESVLGTVAGDLCLQIESNKFVDFIPKEFDIVEESISMSESEMSYSLTENNEKLTVNWAENTLQEKVYNISFVAVVNKSELPSSILNKTYRMNTNGRTVYDGTDNKGSAYMYFSDKGEITLDSPKLAYEANTSSVVDDTAIKVNKSAELTSINGSYWDENDNPYVKIDFEIDLTSVNLQGQDMNLIDYIPSEYTIIESAIDAGEGTYSIMNNNILSFNWNGGALQNKTYYISFVTLLDVSKISEQYAGQFTDRKIQVYTNGTTIDINRSSDKSSILTLGDSKVILKSPILTLENYNTYSIILNTNNGTILKGKYVDSYIKGIGATLPTGLEVYRDNYEFVGWYESPNFLGEKVEVIGKNEKGNKIYWAKWKPIPNGDITINKTSNWTKVNDVYTDPSGNPYVRVTFDVDLTFAYPNTVGNYAYLYDTIPEMFSVLPETISCSDSRVNVTSGAGKIEAKWPSSNIELKEYQITFIMKLDISSDGILHIRKDTDYIFTNSENYCPDCYTEDDTLGGAYFEYGATYKKIELVSPKLRLDMPFKITLNTNGGMILDTYNITEYKPGISAVLPTKNEINKPGYIFAGWYDNSGLAGAPIVSILATDRGDKEYWAKWIPESEGAKISKSAQWTTYNGKDTDENGNPYAKIDFEVDLTTANLSDYIDNSGGTGNPSNPDDGENLSKKTEVVVIVGQCITDNAYNMNTIMALRAFVKETFNSSLGSNLRMAVALYNGGIEEIVSLSDSAASSEAGVLGEIGYYNINGDSCNTQQAIVWAQRQFTRYGSSDANKILIDMSNSMPTSCGIAELEGATINDSDVYYVSTSLSEDEKARIFAKNQMDIARELVPGLHVIEMLLNDVDSASGEMEYYEYLSTVNKDENENILQLGTQSVETLATELTAYMLENLNLDGNGTGGSSSTVYDKTDVVIVVGQGMEDNTYNEEYVEGLKTLVQNMFDSSLGNDLRIAVGLYTTLFYPVVELNETAAQSASGVINSLTYYNISGSDSNTHQAIVWAQRQFMDYGRSDANKVFIDMTNVTPNSFGIEDLDEINVNDADIYYNNDTFLSLEERAKENAIGQMEIAKQMIPGLHVVELLSFDMYIDNEVLEFYRSLATTSKSGTQNVLQFGYDMSANLADLPNYIKDYVLGSGGTSTDDTDIVILMSAGNQVYEEIVAQVEQTKELIHNLYDNISGNLKVAVALYNETVFPVVTLDALTRDNYITYLDASLTSDLGYYYQSAYSNVQEAYVWAQRQLKDNGTYAARKIIIDMSAGIPNYSGIYSLGDPNGADVAFEDAATEDIYLRLAKKQRDMAISLIPGLHIVQVPLIYGNTETYEYFKYMATKDKNGELNILSSTSSQDFTVVLPNFVYDIDIHCPFNRTSTGTGASKTIKLVDIIPPEFEVVQGTIKSENAGDGVNITHNDDSTQAWSTVTFDMAGVALENKAYRFSMVTKLNKDMIPASYTNDYINTNGITIDVNSNSAGSCYVNMGDDTLTLESPSLKYVIEKEYTVKLNTNGGIIATGKNVTKYTEGTLVWLPDYNEISKSGYVFQGWYDNSLLTGDPIVCIPENATGNKEYWAKWGISKVGNVNLSKSASWTSINGNMTDDKENPYAKIEFNLDLSGADVAALQTIAKVEKTTDVVLMLDLSESVAGTAADEQIEAIKSFVDELFAKNKSVRLAVGAYNASVHRIVSLNNDVAKDPDRIKGMITSIYDSLKEDNMLEDGKDVQAATIWAQREFMTHSKADNKVLLFTTDGIPSYLNEKAIFSGTDVISKENSPSIYSQTEKIYGDEFGHSIYDIGTIAQVDYAKKLIPGLNVGIVSMNYSRFDAEDTMSAKKLINVLASKDNNGNLLYWEGNTSNYTEDGRETLTSCLTDAVNQIKNINNIQLVDYIPAEYDILESTITSSDTNVVVKNENNRLVFDLSNVDLEKKVYKFSVCVKLVKDRIDDYVLINNDFIYTNGITINIKDVSDDSSYFRFDDESMISLESPKLSYKQPFKVVLHPNGGTIIEGKNVTNYYPGTGKVLPIEGEIYREGFYFKGWYDNEQLLGMSVAYITTTDTGDKHFWAKWEEIGEVEVRKSAEWEADKDLDGNSYVKIDFEVDLTKFNATQLEKLEVSESADIVLLLDFSSSLSKEAALKERDSALQFVDNLFENNKNVRVASAAFSRNIEEITTFENTISADGKAVRNAIFNKYDGRSRSGTDIQGAIIWAQRQLIRYSDADNKIIVLLTDGEPSVANGSGFRGSDVMSSRGGLIDGVKKQIDYAKENIEDLQVATIGFDLMDMGTTNRNRAINLLKYMATYDKDGKLMYYEAETGDQFGMDDLLDVMDSLTQIIEVGGQKSVYLVDYIPQEFDIQYESIELDDPNIIVTIEDGKLMFDFTKTKLECRTYKISFKIKLNMDKISDDVLNNNVEIYTNGSTLDIRENSTGSAYVTYGDKKIELDSPKVSLNPEFKVNLYENGGKILPDKIVTKYTSGEVVPLPNENEIFKKGYDFLGWYDNEQCIGSPVIAIPADARGNKNYWAKWEKRVLNKTADYTKYNNQVVDEEGNPYVNIDFEVDLGKVDLNEVRDASVDVAIIFDNSESMGDSNINYEINQVKNFVSEYLSSPKGNRRIAVAMVAGYVQEVVSLRDTISSDGTAINNKIDSVYNATGMQVGTDIQSALIWAQRQFIQNSTADKKVIIIMTDGGPSTVFANNPSMGNKPYQGEDVINKYPDLINYNNSDYGVPVTKLRIEQTLLQREYAMSKIDNLQIMSVEMNMDDTLEDDYEDGYLEMAHEFMSDMATTDDEGNKYYYKANTNAADRDRSISTNGITINSGKEEEDDIVGDSEDLKDVLEDIKIEIDNMLDIKVVDVIPSEFELLEDSIIMSDENVRYEIENDRIIFRFDMNRVDNKIYTFSFVTKLKIDDIADDIIYNNDEIYTNGATIDIRQDSMGSAYLELGFKRVEIESPTIKLDFVYNVTLHTNGGAILPGRELTSYKAGVTTMLPTSNDIFRYGFVFMGWFDNEELTGEPIIAIRDNELGDKEFWAKWEKRTIAKTAQWTEYNNQMKDADGNPYVKITFDLDLTLVDMEEVLKNTKGLDVVLLMDFSSGVSSSAMNSQVNAATVLADKLELDTLENRRLAIGACGSYVKEIIGFNNTSANNSNYYRQAIAKAQTDYFDTGLISQGCDIQGGIIWATRQLKQYSDSDKEKVIIILSSGQVSVNNGISPDMGNTSYVGDDVINIYPELQGISGNQDESVTTKRMEQTKAQAEYAISNIPGLKIMTVGMNLANASDKEKTEGFLRDLASADELGEKMYTPSQTVKLADPEGNNLSGITIHSGKEEEDIIIDDSKYIESVIIDISNVLNNGIRIKIVDFIPSEYDLLEDTIYISNSYFGYSYRNNTLVFSASLLDLENKVYSFSFITKLVMDRVSNEIKTGSRYIYTNGSTLDVTQNSWGSSYLEFDNNRTNLDSPQIQLNPIYSVVLHTNGGKIIKGKEVTKYQSGETTILPTANDVIRAGYEFIGWFDNPELIGKPILFIADTETGDKEYWAKWSKASTITLEKTAEWTKINGESADREGKPYVKIDFNIDLSTIDKEQLMTGKDKTTDIVLLLDSSASIWNASIADKLVTSAMTFINNTMSADPNVRIATGLFGEQVMEASSLANSSSSSVESVLNGLEDVYYEYKDIYNVLGGEKTDIQQAIVWAQRQFIGHSVADNKVLVIMSSGRAQVCNYKAYEAADDIINLYPNINNIASAGLTQEVQLSMNTQTVAQMEYAKQNIEGLQVMSVSLSDCLDDITEEEVRSSDILMYNMATYIDENNKMFYLADGSLISDVTSNINSVRSFNGNAGGIVINAGREEDDTIEKTVHDIRDIVNVMINNIEYLNRQRLNLKLVDLIPSEYEFVNEEETTFVTLNDPNFIYKISNNTITFTYTGDDIEAKKYTISFNTKLDPSKIDPSLAADYIYTNGTTIDVTKDSYGSSYLEYGKGQRINLTSPILELALYHNVKLHTNGGTIKPGKDVTFYKEGVGVILPIADDIFKENYDFDGWYDNPDLIGTPVTSIPPTEKEDKEYWAKWTPKVYMVTLHLNGGTYVEGGMGEVTHYTYGVGTELPTGADLYRQKYDFLGWYDNPELSGTPVTSITPTDSGDKEYWASWEEITIEIENDMAYIYIAKNYEDIYAADRIKVYVDDIYEGEITAYLTATESRTSKVLSDEVKFRAYQEAYLDIPLEYQEQAASNYSNQEDQVVYVQVNYGSNRRIIKVIIRCCMSFEQH